MVPGISLELPAARVYTCALTLGLPVHVYTHVPSHLDSQLNVKTQRELSVAHSSKSSILEAEAGGL